MKDEQLVALIATMLMIDRYADTNTAVHEAVRILFAAETILKQKRDELESPNQ